MVFSDRLAGVKRLVVGERHAGSTWECVIGGHPPVVVGQDGAVEIPVSDGGLSVYVPADAVPLLRPRGRLVRVGGGAD